MNSLRGLSFRFTEKATYPFFYTASPNGKSFHVVSILLFIDTLMNSDKKICLLLLFVGTDIPIMPRMMATPKF